MESTYVKNLICKVINKSESDNWDDAVMEWEIIDCEEDESCSEMCICGKENIDRKSTRLNSSHSQQTRMPSSA